MARYEKTARMFRILEMLRRSRYGLRLDQISRELGCSARTVRRYLDAMQSEALYPIYSDASPNGRVWKLLDSHKETTLLPLSLEEVRGLVMAKKLLASKGERSGITDALESITRKLRSQSDHSFDRLVSEIDRLIVSTPLQADIPVGVIPGFEKVAQAIRKGVMLEFDYLDRRGAVSNKRRVAPLTYCMSEGKIHLVAHCYLRNAIRQFSPARMTNVRLSRQKVTETFAFDPDEYARTSFGAFRFEPAAILLRIEPWLVEHFSRTPAHPTQELFARDGNHYLRFTAGPDWAVVRWVCQFGPEVEVLEPLGLRDWVARTHAEALAKYQK